MTTHDTPTPDHEAGDDAILEYYKNLSEDEQDAFEEELINMLTAFIEYQEQYHDARENQ